MTPSAHLFFRQNGSILDLIKIQYIAPPPTQSPCFVHAVRDLVEYFTQQRCLILESTSMISDSIVLYLQVSVIAVQTNAEA